VTAPAPGETPADAAATGDGGLIHGTAVAIGGRGLLLRGPPGAGKSDLALRLIGLGAVLIADDQVRLYRAGPCLLAAPPDTIAGLIELRGVGIRRLPYCRDVPLALIVDLVPEGAVERLPEPAVAAIDGITLPTLSMAPFEASAALKLRLALDADAQPCLGAADAGSGGAPRVGYKNDGMSDHATRDRRQFASSGRAARPLIVLITGMSGAGRTSSLKMLEDLGYEAVDNLPLSLLPGLVGLSGQRAQPIAVGIDIRTRGFAVVNVLGELEKLVSDRGLDCRLVFVDCDDEALARRYTETRRRHPLAGDRPVMDGIRLERDLVSPLRARADLVIDTSVSKPADLKRILAGHFALDDRPGLKLFVTSFSFRQGLPREADLVFDVRFLDNPYYDPALRELTGLDPSVGAHVAADPGYEGFFASLTALLRPLLPRYDHEGKSYLTIAIGCTGGRHRSVYVAEQLGRWLIGEGQVVTVAHRDITRPVGSINTDLPPLCGGPIGDAP
jgi:RNase adaptor protein for sRNA GlmZ degradation